METLMLISNFEPPIFLMLQLLPSDALIAVLSLIKTCCHSFWVVFLLKFGTGNTVCPYT